MSRTLLRRAAGLWDIMVSTRILSSEGTTPFVRSVEDNVQQMEPVTRMVSAMMETTTAAKKEKTVTG